MVGPELISGKGVASTFREYGPDNYLMTLLLGQGVIGGTENLGFSGMEFDSHSPRNKGF